MGQTTIVRGKVSEVGTNEALPFATITFSGSDIFTQTDEKGEFIIRSEAAHAKIMISGTGYKPQSRDISPGKDQTIQIKMAPDSKNLEEITIKAQKTKYRNKNNPAVDLIRQVIVHKEHNRQEDFEFCEFEKYEKVMVALSDVTENFQNKKVLRNFQFVFKNLDTSSLPGKPILPVYLKESLSHVYYRKSPKKRKEIVTGNKMITFEGYVDPKGLEAYIKYMAQDINIYENSVTLLTNQFTSPISGLAPTFYKFFISDTIAINGNYLVKLDFAPRNHSDFLFQGSLYVTLDGNYAVSKIDMGVNKDINLNWIKEVRIVQDFEKNAEQRYALVRDELSAEFGVKLGKMGMYGRRTTLHKNVLINTQRHDSIYTGGEFIVSDSANSQKSNYWAKNRPEELSRSEAGVYTTLDSVKKMPAFKRSLEVVVLLMAGFKTIGPYFDMGPVSTFYSFNPVEGFRLRFGGKTTTAFSKRITFEGYTAYGFKDKKWKFNIAATYSFSKRSIYEFPVTSIKVDYQQDTKIPGQDLQFVNEDNILLAFKRGINTKWLYNKTAKVEYLHEFRNHFSFAVGFKNYIQQPAGSLRYTTADYTKPDFTQTYLQSTEFSLTLRWSPNEQFYQGKTYRIPVSHKSPVFTLRYSRGFKGLFDGQYDYQNVTINISKRFYLSQLGYTDVVLEGGRVFGTVPFPLLIAHRANQAYGYQFQSYNLMNFLEFVGDRYSNLHIDHCFNGFIFNKIPLIRRLKWREIVTMKVLYGGISSWNLPSESNQLFKFPTLDDGTPITYSLSRVPYLEGSIAIANVFKVFRFDLVKRFTYLHHPGISTLGFRVSYKFDF